MAYRERLTTYSLQSSLNEYASNSDVYECITNTLDSEVDEPVKRAILIEGAPGIGKTVLSTEIAFEWAYERTLCSNPFLFLIYLHDPKISQEESLDEFVGYVISSDSKNKKVETVVEYLNNTEGRDCIILFDGYDEITQEVKNKSVVAEIIRGKR